MTEQHDTLSQRLMAVQGILEKNKIDFYLISTFDEHLNEYVPEYKQRLLAITGFTGSAGVALICRSGKHQLFVDSRYYLQAEQETDPDRFVVHKLGVKDVPTVDEWISEAEEKQGGICIGFDPFSTTGKNYKKYQSPLDPSKSQLRPMIPNLIDNVWKSRPEAPAQPIYALDDSITGESTASKLERLRQRMEEEKVQAIVLTKLDEIAWITNLRGSDIQYNPVFEAYAIVDLESAFCFSICPPDESVVEKLSSSFEFRPYQEYPKYLKALSDTKDIKIWLDPAVTTMGTYQTLQQGKSKEEVSAYQFKKPSPLSMMKALKNETELQHIQEAHYRSATAKIRCFVSLEDGLAQGKRISEKDYSDWLTESYAQEEGFTDLSFNNIVGFAENSAIVHYGSPDPQKYFAPNNFLLLDTGAQIMGGTTDDTRTLFIGEPDETQIERYTRVLQSHIQLATAVFPSGTNGRTLDAITRAPMWRNGLDYGHGTGHGVGAFLNVHEGPHSIAPTSSSTSFEPGMVVSNEPGFYETDWGGIRLENLYYVLPASDLPPHPEGKDWLKFDTLTFIPFVRRMVNLELMSPDEKNWLKVYHARVWEKISPRLEEHQRTWLRAACDGWE